MLSVATGHDIDYFTKAVASGRENYYTGAVAAGEPPGLWYGAGAETLGLSGEVDAELLEAIYTHLLDPRDPASRDRSTWGEAERLGAPHKAYRSPEQLYEAALAKEPDADPERRAELLAQAERSAHQAVAFLDATFSAPKSVTLLAVGFDRLAHQARQAGDIELAVMWDGRRQAVEDAVLAGARATINHLQQVAGFARAGHHGGGGGKWVDAHEFVVAQFLQHDSRDRDPQLHVHQTILNRVRCADGVWRAVDSRAIHAHRAGAGAIGERVTEAALPQDARLGEITLSDGRVIPAVPVHWVTRPDGKAREIAGVREESRALFSSRRRAITPKAEELVAKFRVNRGREPNALERDHLARQANLLTRAGKSHDGETIEQRLARWEAQHYAELDTGLDQVVADVIAAGREHDTAPEPWSPEDVSEQALAAVAEKRQSWSDSDLMKQVSDALPNELGIAPERVPELLAGLTEVALTRAVRLDEEPTPVSGESVPEDYRRADGSSVFTRPNAARYAFRGQLAADAVLRAAAVERGAAALNPVEAEAFLARFAESEVELGSDQAAALRGVLTSGAQVEVLSAPAGTGKSFLVAALAEAWQDSEQGRAVGLSTGQAATEVLGEEGVTARNIAAWLATQNRLDAGRPVEDDEAFRVHSGDLLVVDEAGMAETGALTEIHRRAAAAGAKLLLVGDPRQLTAIGPGGALADIAERGITYRLTEVRRFEQPWEGPASLRLRDGDTSALGEYAKHGRLVDAGTAEHAEANAASAWLADTLAGKESLLLVGSNEAAARVCSALRAELVALGRVEEHGVTLGLQGTTAGVGDLVQARRNGWRLLGYAGNTRVPINRRCYRVTELRADGGLTVAPVLTRNVEGGERLGKALALPARYVTEHLALGYASTVHAAQGRTVDTSHAVLGASTYTAGAYVALTRGRERNTAWVITRAVPEDAPAGEATHVQPRTARAVLESALELPAVDPTASALTELERAGEAARATPASIDVLIAVVADDTAGRTSATLDRLATDGAITPEQRHALAADEAFGSLERLLRTAELAGHHPDAVLTAAVAERSLAGARSPAQVLHKRVRDALDGRLTPQLSSYADLLPAQLPEAHRAWLGELAAAGDARRDELGAQVAEDPPQWAREALGPVPEDSLARLEWEQRAGWAASARELLDHTDEADPLGPPPPAGLAEKHAVWRAAHTALALPDGGADERELSDGPLRVRVRAYEREQNWAPRYVADTLAETHQQAAKQHTAATLLAARAAAATDPAGRDQLAAAAAQAREQAAALAERARELELVDDARAAWYAATAVTRDAAVRARNELNARGVDLDAPNDRVTAEEWLAAHRAADRAEDPHREIRDEADLADSAHDHPVEPDHRIKHGGATNERAREHEGDRQALGADEPAAENVAPDIRDTATRDTREKNDPAQRRQVPTADETAANVARAQQALVEIEARRQADAAREAEDAARREELTRWAEPDEVAEHDQTDEHTRFEDREHDPVLER